MFKQNVLFGGRIFKTAVAVLLTAVVCHLLGWPPMFAVITAIVTIEPTARDSIKKAFVRFPASAIGAAYSVLFTYLLGDSPFPYAFVTLLTIYGCCLLKLHAGILVATLTGVAMISTIHDEYVSSFFVRLGTTTIGLSISSLVNLWVIRPNYSRDIAERTKQLLVDISRYLERRSREIIQHQPLHNETREQYQAALKTLESIEILCDYQKKEWSFHRFRREDIRPFHYNMKKLTLLRRMLYHLGNLHDLPPQKDLLDKETADAFRIIMESINILVEHDLSRGSERTRQAVAQMLRQRFKLASQQIGQDNLSGDDQPLISDEALLLFELAALMDIADEFRHIQQLEARQESQSTMETADRQQG